MFEQSYHVIQLEVHLMNRNDTQPKSRDFQKPYPLIVSSKQIHFIRE